jgi:hypothetical protein
MPKDPRYASINLEHDVAQNLRTLTAAMTIERGKRVTVSEVVAVLLHLGEQHLDELAKEIKEA